MKTKKLKKLQKIKKRIKRLIKCDVEFDQNESSDIVRFICYKNYGSLTRDEYFYMFGYTTEYYTYDKQQKVDCCAKNLSLPESTDFTLRGMKKRVKNLIRLEKKDRNVNRTITES